jgi:tRNA pseudouridine32 synthase/23S rRNA pseudouridine746 synthase
LLRGCFNAVVQHPHPSSGRRRPGGEQADPAAFGARPRRRQQGLPDHPPAGKRLPGSAIVHRLDWETSGIILLARDADTHRELSRQFHDRETEKAYTALCWGQPELDSGSIDLPLRYDPPTKPRHVVDHEFGKHALTFWRVLERCGDWCRVELTPITGRSHQLRVHMLSIGHPLLGDGLYAHEQALAAWPRLCLHASMLSFTHPQTGERLRFECPAPF